MIGFDVVHHMDGLANIEILPSELIYDPVVREHFLNSYGVPWFGGPRDMTILIPANAPTRGISGLEAYNLFRGIHTWLHNRDSEDFEHINTAGPASPHDYRSIIENYKIWNVRQGVHNFYSAQFEYRNGLVVGNMVSPVPFRRSNDVQGNNSQGTGISSNTGDVHDLHFDGLRIEGFTYGFQTSSADPALSGVDVPFAASSLRNADIRNVTRGFLPTTSVFTHSFPTLMILEDIQVQTVGGGNAPPTADFSYSVEGGYIVTLDASSSSDPDPGSRVEGDGIVAFAWELDGDGDFNDAFGERIRTRLSGPGAHLARLRVWDDQGASAVRDITLNVAQQGPFADVLLNGSFSSTDYYTDAWSIHGFYYQEPSSLFRDEGWRVYGVNRDSSGFIYRSPSAQEVPWSRASQVIRDEHLRVGRNRLSFDLINRNGNGQANSFTVSVFGVNGEWEDMSLDGNPEPNIFGAQQGEIVALLHESIGSSEYNDWTTLSFDLNIRPSGYEYLYIRFAFLGSRSADYIALDNVSLTGIVSNDSPAPSAPTNLRVVP